MFFRGWTNISMQWRNGLKRWKTLRGLWSPAHTGYISYVILVLWCLETLKILQYGCGQGIFSANFCSSWFEHSHPGRLTAGINKKLISFSSWPHIRFIHKVTLYKNNSTPLPPSTGVQVPEQHGEISFGRMEAQEWFQLLQDVEVGLAKQGGIVPHHCGPSRWCEAFPHETWSGLIFKGTWILSTPQLEHWSPLARVTRN